MRIFLMTIAAATLASTAAFADDKPSEDEVKSINATLKAWGCKGGTMEKESEGSGVFEIDDATCADGNQFDVKMNSKFEVTSFTRD